MAEQNNNVPEQPAAGQQPQQPAGAGPAESKGNQPKRRSLPQIRHSNQLMRRVTKWTLDAVKLANQPPKLFQQGGILVRIRRDEDQVFTETLALDALRGHLDQAADYVRVYRTRRAEEDGEIEYGPPPLDFVRDVMALPGWPEEVFPRLRGIVRCPYFTAAGQLVTEAGYHAGSKLWYEPDPRLTIDRIPDAPSDGEIERAKHWLLRELLVDFPFQMPADQANALAYLLTPFVREMVQGPVPMALIEAPTAGTGKGLLANALAIPATGQPLDTTPQREHDEEWRKAITAKLRESPTHILFDNLTGTLRSHSLEAALTAEIWSDRFLGETRVVRTKIRSIWLATANNLQVAGDLPRRIVWIRLDAKMEWPEDRDPAKFRHPQLLAWAKANRGMLIWAALTLVRAWTARGQEAGQKTMGSYESWAATLGGVLRVAGLNDFLTNLKQLRQSSDSDLLQLMAFVEAWYKDFKDQAVSVAELFNTVAQRDDLLPFVMEAEKEIGRRQRLGRYLAKNRDRTVGEYQVVQLEPNKRSRCLRYQLKRLVTEASDEGNRDTSPSPATAANQGRQQPRMDFGPLIGDPPASWPAQTAEDDADDEDDEDEGFEVEEDDDFEDEEFQYSNEDEWDEDGLPRIRDLDA